MESVTSTADQVEINPHALRLVRKLRNLKQATVAVQAGISTAYLSEMESGKKLHPSREVLAGLMEALALTPDEERAITRYWTYTELLDQREAAAA